MKKTSWTWAGLLAGLCCLVLAAARAEAQAPAAGATGTQVEPSLPPPTSTLDVVRRRGVLRVGVAVNVPWVMNTKSGELIGFEIDVARQLAEDLGVKVDFVPGAPPNLLDDLLDDRFDVIITGMAISPERALVANFTIPVSEASARLLANRSKAAGVRTAAGFDRPEVTIGVRAGAIGEGVAKKAFPKAKIQAFDDEDALIDAVMNAKVTAIVAWSPAPEFMATKGSDKIFVPVVDPLATRREAMAVRKGDPDFLAYLDTWIRYQRDTGWLAEKRKYWFDSFAWEDQL